MPEFIRRYPRWAHRVLRRADVLVAPSPFLARAVGSIGLRAEVIPNVLDLSLYPWRRRSRLAPRLFWMRTFHPVYNPGMAVRVLARVRQTWPNAVLVIAGQDKGLQKEVRLLATQLGVSDSVRFPGFLDRPSKLRALDESEVFLNTNRVDNMPVSVLEACAAGVPVVSTNVGGIGDLLSHEETALLVPDDDDQAMSHSVLRLLDDGALAGHLSFRGRQLAENSSWERLKPRWESMLADLTAGTVTRCNA